MKTNVAACYASILLLGTAVSAHPLLADPLMRSEDFDSSTDSFDVEGSNDETNDNKRAVLAVTDKSKHEQRNAESKDGNSEDITKILEELEATAKQTQVEDTADIDLTSVSSPFIEEETLASLIKAVHASIMHTQAHAAMPAAVLKNVALEAKQIQKDIELRRTGTADPASEQKIADEIHKLQDHMKEVTSLAAKQGAEEEIAGVLTNVGAHIDETKGGAGNPVEEKKVGKEIDGINDALMTRLTGKGNVAVETQMADDIKRVVAHTFGTRADVTSFGESHEDIQTDSSEEISIEEDEETETAAVTEESAIGKLIHGMAGFITGDGTGDDGSLDNGHDQDKMKEVQPTTKENKLREDEESYSDNNSESSTSKLSSADTSSDLAAKTISHQFDSNDDEEAYQPANHKSLKSMQSDSEITVQADMPAAETKTWHLTAMTVTMCAVIGMVLLVVVGIWYRRMSFRGGNPAAGQLVLEDDEDAVYTATTQPSDPPLGRYSKLT